MCFVSTLLETTCPNQLESIKKQLQSQGYHSSGRHMMCMCESLGSIPKTKCHSLPRTPKLALPEEKCIIARH